MKIDNSTILITGGSSGLGAACVEQLVRSGAKVIVADLTSPSNRLSDNLADRVLFAPTDVTRESELEDIIAAGQERFGPLRGAVVCAGIMLAERLLPRDRVASLPKFRQVIEVNLIGSFNTVRLASQAIARSAPDEDGQRGVIVLTSSTATFDGQVGQAAYSASKGGIAAMTLPLARELGQLGIRVVSVAPGAFDTPMMQALPDHVQQSVIDQMPFPKRLGQADEFASLVTHIFENSMLNGCVLRLDGALRMGPR